MTTLGYQLAVIHGQKETTRTTSKKPLCCHTNYAANERCFACQACSIILVHQGTMIHCHEGVPPLLPLFRATLEFILLNHYYCYLSLHYCLSFTFILSYHGRGSYTLCLRAPLNYDGRASSTSRPTGPAVRCSRHHQRVGGC